MHLKLIRSDSGPQGIFGTLSSDEEGSVWVAATAEHAYPDCGSFSPKLPPGKYVCKRGMHQLHDMNSPFETFEITGVPFHKDILFHFGNYPQIDSDGCVLLGQSRLQDMVTYSRHAFNSFMTLQKGIDTFNLTIA